METKEEWKDVIGFEGFFKVSNLGRVKGIDRIVYYGGHFAVRKEHLRVLGLSQKGYQQVNLTRNGWGKTKRVHRLVCECFIPNPNNYPMINHINGIKTDNRVENLEWCNNGMNQLHAYQTGLKKCLQIGEKSVKSKLKEKDILEIRRLHATGNYSLVEIGRMFNIYFSTVHKIAKRQCWKHI